jgi:hypothetical protein
MSGIITSSQVAEKASDLFSYALSSAARALGLTR